MGERRRRKKMRRRLERRLTKFALEALAAFAGPVLEWGLKRIGTEKEAHSTDKEAHSASDHDLERVS